MYLDEALRICLRQEPNLVGEAKSRAAVAAVLRPSGEGVEVLFIRRAEHPKDPWSGQMAFPGGRHEPHDEGLEGTARRETLEEVGVDLHHSARLLGQLDDVPASAGSPSPGLVISIFVYELVASVELSVDESEVADAVWAEVAPMRMGAVDTMVEYQHSDLGKLTLPGFKVGEHVVWGLTYKMLRMLFERATDVPVTK